MKPAFLLLLLVASPVALADIADCSVHPPSGKAQAKLAKIKLEEARATAVAHVHAAATAKVESELEVEKGCLVYSFDIKQKGQSGTDEVIVDAGDGKILSVAHETPSQEAAEASADKKEHH